MEYLSENMPLICLFVISTGAKRELRFDLEAIYAGSNALKNCQNDIAIKLKFDRYSDDAHHPCVYNVEYANNDELDGFIICINDSDNILSGPSFPFSDMTYKTKFTHIGSRNDKTQEHNIGKNKFVGFLIEKCTPIHDVSVGDGF